MALAKLAVLMNQKPSTRLAFSELFERWKAAVVPTLKESTANNYVYNLKQYVVPTFGNREVSALGRYDVETFLGRQSKDDVLPEHTPGNESFTWTTLVLGSCLQLD